jgi:pyrroline-5-carboxylate reductase
MYGIIGVGAMASAIVAGLCGHGDEAPPILLSPRNAAAAAGLARRFSTVRIAGDNQAVLDGAGVVILCVRPQDAGGILTGLKFAERHRIISVMAGVSTARLQALVAPARDISRAIPMQAVAARDGTTPVFPENGAAAALFGRLGRTIGVQDEAAFEAFSAATGTVATYFAYLQAICQWLAANGIPEGAARDYVARIYAGLAGELADGADFPSLAREHMTQGGINEQFLGVMREAGAFDAVAAGLNGVFGRLRPVDPI